MMSIIWPCHAMVTCEGWNAENPMALPHETASMVRILLPCHTIVTWEVWNDEHHMALPHDGDLRRLEC